MLQQTLQYSIASIVSAAIGLLSAICFTRLLSPEEYGVYVVGLSTAGVVSAVLFTWVRVSALRFQSEGGTVDVRKTVLLAYLISVLAAPIAFVVATMTTAVPSERTLAAIGFALGLGLFEIGQELQKARLQSLSFMAASIVRACLAFALCLISALLGGGGLGQLAMAAVAYFVTATVFALVIWRKPRAPIDFTELLRFAQFGVPLTISGFIFAIHAALDRMLVFHLMGDAAAGHYGASADLVRQIILIPSTSIASATIPLAVRAFARGGIEDTRRHLETSFEILLAAILPAVVGFALTANFVADIVLGSEFRETAAQILPILVFAWLFQSITQSYVHVSFHLAKRPFMIALQGTGMLLVNLATMPLLIDRYGLDGAACALVITELFGVGFGWLLARRAFPLPFNLMHALRIGLATAAMALVLAILKKLLPESLLTFCILVACGSATYLLAAFALDIVGIRKAVLGPRLARRLALSKPAV
ncbi:oligosaccharide flippase family protein [Bradyrhizobium sp. NP1]|uniref:lipopolysaccharide biosynthesis protein n=1 Tax=Bradyrhizobium sp. NP1 TaxID=3049772 RepID=UPI0025A4E161|nr:oligosaccharide flippase family protein [Bradyrhizobium sp. NP1]WJR79506.1 oligosaccharide flippase family protein [Bradyrhizobium sp. NP1]